MQTLIFLHGFLGDPQDFQEMISYLPQYRCIALTLPGHGSVPYRSDLSNYLFHTITSLHCNHITLIGYSMGGRLAIELARKSLPNLNHLILLSTHLGIQTEKDMEDKKRKDLYWISLLEQGSMPNFLEKWYQQPLFSTLSKTPDLFTRRLTLNPSELVRVLKEQGVGYRQSPPPHPTLYLYGKEDLKYATLYSKLPAVGIAGASHAIHLEKPRECADIINTYLENICPL